MPLTYTDLSINSCFFKTSLGLYELYLYPGVVFNGGHLLFEFLLVFKSELGCTFESLHAKVCLGTTESEKSSSFRY